MTGTSLLSVRDAARHYGGVAALSDGRLELAAGEVHALMGENGAGKSTLARILAGAEQPDQGEIRIDGVRISFGSPLDAQRAGIAIIHQELDLFPHLSVGENIVIANLQYRERLISNAAAIGRFAGPFLGAVGVAADHRAMLGSLPIAQQQLVAIARALSMGCRMILMDEPTSALTEEAAERLFALIATLKQGGISIVYISHRLEEIFRLCDRVTVLRDGRTIASRDTAATDTDELIRLMVGRPIVAVRRRSQGRAAGPAVLFAEELATARLRGVSFEVARGEILGIAGLLGAGRSALGRALVGLDPLRSGDMALHGARYRPAGPADAQRSGVCLLPEDRKTQGLMLDMSACENASIAVLPALSRCGIVRRRAERARVAALLDRLGLAPRLLDRPMSKLSGGNQQKVLLARWLLASPALLFLDDPTRGVDVGAKDDIYRIIAELAAAGTAIILASSELAELFSCADRILVLNQGRAAATLSTADTDQEAVMRAATRGLAAASVS